jgi:type IV secretion system protein VirD4
MYKLIRLLLILAAAGLLYCAIFFVVLGWPVTGWFVGAALICRSIQKGRHYLTTLGSARWANENELDRSGMLDAKSGLILGRLPGGKNS